MSIICPNMSNPDVAREFNELKAATNERAAYAIWSLNNGNGIDKAPNGAESKLFKRLLMKFDFVMLDAIKAKAKMYAKSFFNKFGDWTNQKSEIDVDENGEPDLFKDQERIDRFVDKLLLKHRPYRSIKKASSDRYELISDLKTFFRDLLGVDLEFDADDTLQGDVKQQIKDNVEFFINNELQTKIKQRLLELRSIYDSTEYIPVDQYLQNMYRFLERMDLSVLDEYDKKTQEDIQKLFPKLFNHRDGVNINSIFGLYKHALLSKRGNTYENIYKIANSQNINRLATIQRIKKLQTVDYFLNAYPGAKRRIKNRLFNEIDRRFDFESWKKNAFPISWRDDISPEDVSRADNTYNTDGVVKYTSGIIQKGKVYSAKDIITTLSNNSKYKTECETIYKTLDKLGDIKVFGVKMESRGLGGFYDPNDHSVYINVDSILYSETPEQTIVHELFHAITTFYLVKNPEFEKSFNEYVELLRQRVPWYITTTIPYGFNNCHEFIAEFMSNDGFRELLKKIKPVENSKFVSIFHEVIDKIVQLLGFTDHNSAYEQALAVVEKVIELEKESYVELVSTGLLENTHYTKSFGNIYFDENGDLVTVSDINNLDDDETRTVVNSLIKERPSDSSSIIQTAQNAKREWVENRQKQILNDTQMRLAKAYGLHQEIGEDGRIRFVSDTDDEKSRLIIDFLDYISGDTEGYYDHNSKSTAAHHVIAISLTNGDPSTFSHELAHHYVRMFWRSKLIQTALRAVDKPGMTDEEREEALVDIITAKTNDTNFMSSIESQSFVLKFWGALANILYNTFGIENEAIRNALFRNITKAFVLNEKQRIINSQNKVFQMADKRMFKKTYREKVKAAREAAHRNKSLIDYELVGEDKTQKAIKSIVQGSVSRNKNFRKNDILNPKILVDMQIAEDRVRKFVEDINEYRKNYLSSLGLTRRPTSKQRRDSVYTPEELNANLELIRGFVSQARDELYDIAERFTSMESAKWAYYITKEVVNPITGDTTTEYLDASHINDPDVTVTQIDFKELSDINQNILGFYDKTIKSLYDAVRSPEFKNLYGEDAQQELLAELTSVNSTATGGIRMLDMLTNLKACYDDAITERLHQFVNQYVRENTPGLSDEKKEKLIYSINTWLENQNAFGDIGAIETWLGLASNSKSSLIRLMQDMIDNSAQELNDAVNSKGFLLRRLRIEAMKALNASKTNDYKFYGFLSPFNIDKLLMERDEDGFTGNFITAVNEGKFYNDRAKFIDKLLFSKGGIQDKLRTALGDPDYELEIDSRGEPVFPEGQDDIEKEFLHEQNHWMGKHAVRRFTVAYYDKRIDMLSSVTRKAQTLIQNQINDIIRACTIDGKVHTELLTPTKVRDLQLLYYRKSQLSNPFDQYGRKKADGTEEALIAKELTEWNKWQSEHVKNKLDYDAFEEAKRNAKDKDQFERDNTYTVINPDIWEEIGRLFPKTASSTIADLRYTRNKLISIIKTKKGLYSPRLELVLDLETGEIRPGYEEFWANLRHYDELIENLKHTNAGSKWTKSQALMYKSLMTSLPIMVNLPGGTQETMYVHIQKKIKKRLENKYGVNDPRVATELAREMENFQYTIRGANGQMSKKGQLSIFSITQPPAQQVSTSKGLIDATIKQPTQAYSVIDEEASDKDYVDERFDATANKPIQPITDDTKRSNDDVSYTNEKYKKYIENGPAALKKYYTTLMDTMRDAYGDIPFAGTYDGRLPQQGARTGQMFHRNRWWNIGKPILYWFRRHFGINESDTDINVDYELRPDGTRAMNIPVRYLRRLDNPNEINSDILGSVIDFYEMSLNYKAKSKMLPLFLTAIDKLERAKTNRDRQKTFLKGIVNRAFYERQRNFDINEDNLVTYTDKWVRQMLKWIPGLRALTTTGLLALNWLAGLVAYLDPAVQIAMDAVAGRYMGADDYIIGTLKMLVRLPAAIISAGKSKSYDKISSGMVKFGLAKTGAVNFRGMDRSQLGRFLGDGILMLPFSLGEHTINAQVFAVTMNSYRYIEDANAYMNRQEYYEYAQSKGIPMSVAKLKFFMSTHTLFDAYKTDKNGEFVTADNKYGRAVTPELENRVGKRMRNRATVSNLIVPGNERTKIQSNVITAFTVVMRTFMLVGISERFRSLRDFQIDDDSPIDENRASKARAELKQDYWADKGGYNFQTGEIEDGIVSAAFHMCAFGELFNYIWQQIRQFKITPKGVDTPRHTKNAIKYGLYTLVHPFRSRYNEKSKLKREELEIPESDIYAFNRIVSELAAIGVLALIQTTFHNKMIDDGSDDEYWNQVIDHILIRLAIVRYTWFDANTFMDLINSITPSKSDIDKKLKFIDLVKDAYKGFQEHGTNYEDWEKVKSGGYKNAPKAFRDLLLTFSSLGLHNIYTSKSTEGVKAKTKWFKKMVWWEGYWHEATPGKKSSGSSRNSSEFGNINDLGGLNDLGGMNEFSGLGGL